MHRKTYIFEDDTLLPTLNSSLEGHNLLGNYTQHLATRSTRASRVGLETQLSIAMFATQTLL